MSSSWRTAGTRPRARFSTQACGIGFRGGIRRWRATPGAAAPLVVAGAPVARRARSYPSPRSSKRSPRAGLRRVLMCAEGGVCAHCSSARAGICDAAALGRAVERGIRARGRRWWRIAWLRAPVGSRAEQGRRSEVHRFRERCGGSKDCARCSASGCATAAFRRYAPGGTERFGWRSR